VRVERTSDRANLPLAGFEEHIRGLAAFGEFSILYALSTIYAGPVLTHCDPIHRILSVKLSQFYHGSRIGP
jgi:hypothetical protein